MAPNPLSGKPLHYLIGKNDDPGIDGYVTEVGYDATTKPAHGIGIKYCNLFDEKNSGKYGPYLSDSDTAEQYGEGQIDPTGPGWDRNLFEQFKRAKLQGFEYVELDNPDAYRLADVVGAIGLAANYGLKIIAKNPGLNYGDDDATPAVAHPNVFGIIVEKGAGTPAQMDAMRRKAGKPDLPVWFVSFGAGNSWARAIAKDAANYRNMGVTYSSVGEYGSSTDLLKPAVEQPMVNKPSTLEADIATFAANSDAAKYPWGGRGRAPVGYIKGMAVAYNRVYAKWKSGDSAALVMARPVESSPNKDALAWYSGQFSPAGLKGGLDTLRSVFVLLTGLGMRESSGKYCEGRDRSAANTSSDTAETGLFQMSWNAHAASPELPKLFQKYKANPDGLVEVFHEGVKCSASDLANYGDGDGAEFQRLCKSCPAFAVEAAAVGLRTIRSHWGPINRREAEVRPEVDKLLRGVEAMVDRVNGKPVLVPAPAPVAQDDLAGRIVWAMKRLGYAVAIGDDVFNLVYIEGMDADGKANASRPNAFDSLRILLRVPVSGPPKIVFQQDAITHAGMYWEMHRMSPAGAFHIALGPQACWMMGAYHDQPALIQSAPIIGTRDDKNNFKREGPAVRGDFGVHHHGGYNYPKDDAGKSSAGCLVGRVVKEHLKCMELLKTDRRYVANKQFLFPSTVMTAAEVLSPAIPLQPETSARPEEKGAGAVVVAGAGAAAVSHHFGMSNTIIISIAVVALILAIGTWWLIRSKKG